jgi:hypothetical protein
MALSVQNFGVVAGDDISLTLQIFDADGVTATDISAWTCEAAAQSADGTQTLDFTTSVDGNAITVTADAADTALVTGDLLYQIRITANAKKQTLVTGKLYLTESVIDA